MNTVPRARLAIIYDIFVSTGSVKGLSPDRHQALPELIISYCQLPVRPDLKWFFNRNLTTIFHHQHAFENFACKVAAISYCAGLSVFKFCLVTN